MKKLLDMDREEFLDVIKELQTGHIEQIIRKIVKEEFASERTAFWVPAERHYIEHQHLSMCVVDAEEREKNHEFISDLRKKGKTAFSIGLGMVAVAVFGFIGAAISEGFRHLLLTLIGRE